MGIATIGSSARYARKVNRINDKAYGKDLAVHLDRFKWRFRIQESFFLTLQGLDGKDLISRKDCFQYPIDWRRTSATVSRISKVLKCFEIAEECSSITSDDGLFDDPVIWLAVAIARTCPDVPEAFEFLRQSGILGTFNEEEFMERGMWDSFSMIDVQINPKEMACDVQTCPPQIGFWLPQNIKGKGDMYPWACNVRDRYEAMKGAYEKCYGIGSWGYDAIEPTVEEWIG